VVREYALLTRALKGRLLPTQPAPVAI
jgi:hypothetical protein